MKSLTYILTAVMVTMTLAACDSTMVDDSTTASSVESINPTYPAALAKNSKIPICHYNSGKDDYYKLFVSPTSLASHLGHGDHEFVDEPGDSDPNDGDGIFCGLQSNQDGFLGFLVYASVRDGNLDIYMWDGEAETRLTTHPGDDFLPTISADGSQVAFHSNRAGGPRQIYVLNIDGSGVTQITFGDVPSERPSWSPDGTKIAYTGYVDGDFELFTMNPDGSNQTRLTYADGYDGFASWSPDGTMLVFRGERPGTDLYVINADGTGEYPLDIINPGTPDWSPDGSTIVFSKWDGLHRVDPDGNNLEQFTFTSGYSADNAEWSPDGAKILFGANKESALEVRYVNADGTGETPDRHATGSGG